MLMIRTLLFLACLAGISTCTGCMLSGESHLPDSPTIPNAQAPIQRTRGYQAVLEKPRISNASSETSPIVPVSAVEQVPDTKPSDLPAAKPLPANESSPPLPAYAKLDTLPIDLPTVIRLVDANSPMIGVAQARVREAQARLDKAEVQWLPNLSIGSAYNRFDGQTQNQAGLVFDVSRANLFMGGGATLAIDTAEAYYRPLIEQRQTQAEQFRAESIRIGSELEAVLAYFDLVQIHAQLEINAVTLKQAEDMLVAAKNAKLAKLDRVPGDVNRAQLEVLSRRTERIELEGRVGIASARLARLLLLPGNVKLVPADSVVVPTTLINDNATIDELIRIALEQRPDLAANRQALAAAWERVRSQQFGPLFPKVIVQDQAGVFGGGINDDLQKFNGRNALSAQVFWEIRNLGFGNRADTNERRAQAEQAQLQLVEAQARSVAEIIEAAQIAAARYEALEIATRGIKEASELYRINKEGTFNVIDAKNLFDALRPLQAIQLLNQARVNYLNAVLDYNRAQYRLYAALGRPPLASLPTTTPSK